MSNSDILDVVDMLEKKHGFSREDAKMLIDYMKKQPATKTDLDIFKIEIQSMLDENFYKIEKLLREVKK